MTNQESRLSTYDEGPYLSPHCIIERTISPIGLYTYLDTEDSDIMESLTALNQDELSNNNIVPQEIQDWFQSLDLNNDLYESHLSNESTYYACELNSCKPENQYYYPTVVIPATDYLTPSCTDTMDSNTNNDHYNNKANDTNIQPSQRKFLAIKGKFQNKQEILKSRIIDFFKFRERKLSVSANNKTEDISKITVPCKQKMDISNPVSTNLVIEVKSDQKRIISELNNAQQTHSRTQYIGTSMENRNYDQEKNTCLQKTSDYLTPSVSEEEIIAKYLNISNPDIPIAPPRGSSLFPASRTPTWFDNNSSNRSEKTANNKDLKNREPNIYNSVYNTRDINSNLDTINFNRTHDNGFLEDSFEESYVMENDRSEYVNAVDVQPFEINSIYNMKLAHRPISVQQLSHVSDTNGYQKPAIGEPNLNFFSNKSTISNVNNVQRRSSPVIFINREQDVADLRNKNVPKIAPKPQRNLPNQNNELKPTKPTIMPKPKNYQK